MATRWSTKEEVQADLARATGQSTPLVDEGCLVYGDCPPPRRLTADEDTEEEHWLRCMASTAQSQQPSPDLQGITNMLRMIQDYGNGHSIQNSPTPNDELVFSSKSTPLSHKQDPIKYTRSVDSSFSSKLNPTVKEFVPKFSTATRNKSKIEDSNPGMEPSETLDESETDNNVQDTASENTEHGAADSMTVEQRQEREELSIMLKNRTPAPTHDGPLLTPDYFRTHRVLPSERADGRHVPSERADGRHVPSERADVRYVPSAGARALRAQYAERAVAAPAPPPSLWERLERDLRRKDAERSRGREELWTFGSAVDRHVFES